MKLKIVVDTDKHLDIPWPDGVPIPAAGDQVLMKTSAGGIAFTVESRFFGIGTGIDGQPGAQVRIRGKCPPSTGAE